MNLAAVYKKSVGFLNKLLLMFHDFARRFFDFTFFPFLSNTISHIIHGTGIFTYIYHQKSTIHAQKNPPTSALGAVRGKRQVDWMESCEGDGFFSHGSSMMAC